MSTIQPDISTILEEPSILETSKRSRTSDHTAPEMPSPKTPRQSTSTIEPQNVSDIFGPAGMDSHIDLPEVPRLPFDEEGPPSIAPFSVGPQSVGPPSCGPPSAEPVVIICSLMIYELHLILYSLFQDSVCQFEDLLLS